MIEANAESMKRLATFVLALVAALLVTWLCGAFISLEPNPLAWSEYGRFSYLTFSLWAAFMASILP